MSERTRLGLGILGAAAALGILGDLLLRDWRTWSVSRARAADYDSSDVAANR